MVSPSHERGPPHQPKNRIIAFGGGKGGVGKSVLAANLAIAMAERASSVVLIDADFGMANQHTLFGIERPGPGCHGFLRNEAESLAAAAVPTGVPRLSLIPGNGSDPGAANINHWQKQRLIRHIRKLDHEVVVVDVGAGAAYNTLDLFDMSDVRVVVIVAQVTSVQNAYGFLKGSVHRLMTQVAAAGERKAIFEEASKGFGKNQQVAAVIEAIRRRDPQLAADMENSLEHYAARVIGNYLLGDQDRRVVAAICRMMRDFLGVQATVIGNVPASRRLYDSINERIPLLCREQPGPAGAELRHIARVLLAEDVGRIRAGRGPGPLLAGQSPIDKSWSATAAPDGSISSPRLGPPSKKR